MKNKILLFFGLFFLCISSSALALECFQSGQTGSEFTMGTYVWKEPSSSGYYFYKPTSVHSTGNISNPAPAGWRIISSTNKLSYSNGSGVVGPGSTYNYVRDYYPGDNYPDDCPNDPSHCSDGISNDGLEDGQDCGGACSSACVSSCPPGSFLFDAGTNDRCVREYHPDNYGNCGSMDHYYYPPDTQWPNGYCSEVFDPFLAKEPVNLPELDSPFSKNTYVQKESSTSIVTNPDGTKTETTTTTTTGTDANGKPTSETTTNTKTYDTEGNLIGESSSSSSDKEGSENSDILGALIGNKEGSLSNLIKAGNNANSQGLSVANSSLNDIKDSLNSLTTDAEGVETGIVSSIDTAGDDALDVYDQSIQDQIDNIIDYDGSSMPVPETLTDALKSVVPDPQACSPVTFTSPSGRSFTVECQTFDRTRLILAWLVAIWTVHSIYNIFIGSKS